jgi:hypothetical protein
MFRVLLVGLSLLIAQAVPAFAEQITLQCGANFWTFDLDAKTVNDPEWDSKGSTHPIQVTHDYIYWSAGGGKRMYNRNTSQLTIYEGSGASYSCQRVSRGPL